MTWLGLRFHTNHIVHKIIALFRTSVTIILMTIICSSFFLHQLTTFMWHEHYFLREMQLNNMKSFFLFFISAWLVNFFFISACSQACSNATSVQSMINFHSPTCLKDHPSCSLCLSARLYSLLLLAISPRVPGHGTKQPILLQQRRATGVLSRERGGVPSNRIEGGDEVWKNQP